MKIDFVKARAKSPTNARLRILVFWLKITEISPENFKQHIVRCKFNQEVVCRVSEHPEMQAYEVMATFVDFDTIFMNTNKSLFLSHFCDLRHSLNDFLGKIISRMMLNMISRAHDLDFNIPVARVCRRFSTRLSHLSLFSDFTVACRIVHFGGNAQ